MDGVTETSNIYVQNKDSQTSVTGLESPTKARAAMLIEDNDMLGNLSALSKITSVGDTLGGGQLKISGNALLATLVLDDLTTVDNTFTITDNPGLPTCLADALRLQISIGGGTSTISGNDDVAMCP